jgi:hypothetical protein
MPHIELDQMSTRWCTGLMHAYWYRNVPLRCTSWTGALR